MRLSIVSLDSFNCILVMLKVNERIFILHHNIPYRTTSVKHFFQIISSSRSGDTRYVNLSEIFFTSTMWRHPAWTSRVTSSIAWWWWSWSSTLAWGRSSSTSHSVWLRVRWSWISSAIIHTVTAISFSLLFFIRFPNVSVLFHFNWFTLLDNLRIFVGVYFGLVCWWMWSRAYHILI